MPPTPGGGGGGGRCGGGGGGPVDGHPAAACQSQFRLPKQLFDLSCQHGKGNEEGSDDLHVVGEGHGLRKGWLVGVHPDHVAPPQEARHEEGSQESSQKASHEEGSQAACHEGNQEAHQEEVRN